MYRSRSNSRSGGLYTGPLTRSRSRVGGVQHSASYGGYGSSFSAGYLSRSGSASVFGRSLDRSTYSYTPPLHSVALQRSTPHYSDKYPFVRYSYGSPNVGLGILSSSSALSKNHYSNRGSSYKSYMDTTMSSYGSSLYCAPKYGSSLRYTTSSNQSSSPSSRYSTPRSYVKYMDVDNAVDLYKSRCMTSSTLSKYWLSPTTWQNRRQNEHNLGRSFTSPGSYSYATRYNSSRYY